MTTIQPGNAAAAPRANAMPNSWKSAPPACDRALPCSRSLPESTSGIAADFTARITRTTAWAASRPTISSDRRAGVALGGVVAQRQQDDRGDRRDDRRRDEVGPPHDPTPREAVDEDADEGREQGVRDVQRQHDLQQVVGRRHVLHVEALPCRRTRSTCRSPPGSRPGPPGPGTARPSGSRSRGWRRRANKPLKNPPNASSGRRSQASPSRNATPMPTATATTTQPFVAVSGPRQTARTAMPESSTITTDMPGMRAMRSTRRADLEPAGREPPRNDEEHPEQRHDQQVLRQVVERRRGDPGTSGPLPPRRPRRGR